MVRKWLCLSMLAACSEGADTGNTHNVLSATDSDAAAAYSSESGSSAAVSASDLGYCVPEVGSGELSHPVPGPAPLEAASIGGDAFTLVKNWDFGKLDNVRSIGALSSEFEYHDQFGTIANGTNYGAVTVAPTAATAVNAWNLNLPDDAQPLEDPRRPYRELTEHSLRTYVRTLDPTQDSAVASDHNAGNGSIMAKWHMPTAGAAFGHDMLWETRVRIAKPVQGYWLALWAAGTTWAQGPEIDVAESYGSPYVRYNAFHSDAVGGTSGNDFTSWPIGLDHMGVPYKERDLREWHTWSLLYRKDDGYKVYFDGHLVQQGKIHWRVGGAADGDLTGLHFLFDFSWGHTGIPELNIALWTEQFPLVYEIDYSRVYLR